MLLEMFTLYVLLIASSSTILVLSIHSTVVSNTDNTSTIMCSDTFNYLYLSC